MKTKKDISKTLVSMNKQNIEKEKMSELFGGFTPIPINGASPCTASTYTITPSGGQLDTGDSWEGECEGTPPPAGRV